MGITSGFFTVFDRASEYSQKIFIVEGPDGTGKTTVCNILSMVYHLPIIHLGYLKDPEDMDKQYERVYQLIYGLIHHNYPTISTGLIFDRFISSNKVYSSVFKNSRISPWLTRIEKLLNIMSIYYDITFINCILKDKQEYLNRYKDLASIRDELYGDNIEKMAKVYDGYKAEFEKEREIYLPRIRRVNYDFTEQQKAIQGKDLIRYGEES